MGQQGQAATQLAGQIELSRLVDLASQRLHLNIEYDESQLKGTVTLRLGGSVSDQELWDLVNQLLAARGYTTIRGDSGTLSVVKLTDALGAAPVAVEPGAPTGAGFATVAARVQYRPAKEIIDALGVIVSKPGGKVQALPGTSLILISDLSSRTDTALALLAKLDTPDSAVTVERIPVQNLGASQLATLVAQVQAKVEAAGGRGTKGDLLPGPDGTSLLLVAPKELIETWKTLITSLDQRQPLETRAYTPGAFTAKEVGTLIEQSVHSSAAPSAADGWRLVTEDLTGTLVLTATPDQHAQVESLLARLAALPPESRRPVRSFVVRNRGVTDVLQVLQQLVGAGVLDAADEVSAEGAAGNGVGSTSGSGINPSTQRTERQVLPTGATPTIPTASAPAAAWPLGAQPSSAGTNRSQGSSLPRITLTADEGTSTIIAVGEPRLLAQVEHLIQQLDVRQPQVMLEVMLVSLTDGQAMNLGVELEKMEIGSDAVMRLASLFGLSTPLPGGGRTTGQARGFSGVVLDPGDFAVVVRALETVNQGRSLSRPKLLVNNGQQAVFNSVLEQPFISTNASDTVATTSFGGTQDAGTTVSLRPQIAEADHLVLEYSISLSSFVGASTNPALPPPRQQNQVQSVATVPDGYTVVVGGLETTSDGSSVEQVPYIARVPIIGELFKNRSKSGNRTRFFVFLRANVMRGESFEALKYASDRSKSEAALDDGWPEVEPMVIK